MGGEVLRIFDDFRILYIRGIRGGSTGDYEKYGMGK